MSVKTKEKSYTRKTETVVERWCDRCGNTMKPYSHPAGPRRIDVFECKYVKEFSDPDGGGVHKGWQVEDCCESCSEVIKELLEEAAFTIKEIDKSH